MHHVIKSIGTIALGTAAFLSQPTLGQGTTAGDDSQCVSLRGSQACPAFQDAYVNPQNLSTAWPWFTAVSDVTTFDQQFELYFTDPNRYHQTKFQRQLQCNSTAAQNTTLQYQRTILCGQFSQISYSASCNIRNRADPIMVCQDTCLQYAGTEGSIVSNPQICTPDNLLSVSQNNTRYFNLNKDYVTCTDWRTLVSTDNSSCVEGITNEGNCGWGPDVNNQLCAYCDPSGNQTVPACCTDAKTDLSQCRLFGYPGAASIRPTTSIAPTMQPTSSSSSVAPTSSSTDGAGAGDQNGGRRYTGGQIAGIVVGCVVGALLLGLLLGLLCFRRQREKQSAGPAAGANGADVEKSRTLGNAAPSSSNAGAGAAAGAGGGLLAGILNRGGDNEKSDGWARSEKVASPAFAEKEAGRPGSSALSNAPSARKDGSGGAALLAGGAALGAGAGAAAAAAAGGSSRSQSQTPTQMNAKDGDDLRPLSALSTSTVTDGRGTTVPAVRDQYSGLDIQPNDEVVAIYPYSATLTDEMNLEVDDVVTVVRLYDDGWALGRRSGGAEGAFPLVCVTSAQAVDGPASRGLGSSSMPGASSDDDGLSGPDGGISDSADGAVTADEGAITADEDFEPSRRR